MKPQRNQHYARRPHALLDAAREALLARSDAHLADVLGYSRIQIAKIRGRNAPVTDGLILCVHDALGWPISRIKQLREQSNDG